MFNVVRLDRLGQRGAFNLDRAAVVMEVVRPGWLRCAELSTSDIHRSLTNLAPLAPDLDKRPNGIVMRIERITITIRLKAHSDPRSIQRLFASAFYVRSLRFAFLGKIFHHQRCFDGKLIFSQATVLFTCIIFDSYLTEYNGLVS